MSHLYAVSQGDLTGWEHVQKYGVNPALSSAALPATIWEFGGPYNWLTTPSILAISSSNANDTFLGTGARQVRLRGLDANWNPQVEVVNLNGTTPVNTALQWWRINSMSVATCGSSRVNQGNISAVSDGLTREYMAAGVGIARSMVYSVAAGHHMLINLLAWSPIGTDVTNNALVLESQIYESVPNRTFSNAQIKVTTIMTPYHHMADPPVFYGEKVDFSWRCVAATSVPARGAGVYFSASIVDNALHAVPGNNEHPRW